MRDEGTNSDYKCVTLAESEVFEVSSFDRGIRTYFPRDNGEIILQADVINDAADKLAQYGNSKYLSFELKDNVWYWADEKIASERINGSVYRNDKSSEFTLGNSHMTLSLGRYMGGATAELDILLIKGSL